MVRAIGGGRKVSVKERKLDFGVWFCELRDEFG